MHIAYNESGYLAVHPGPVRGSFPKRPWHAVPPRCEHGCLLPNPVGIHDAENVKKALREINRKDRGEYRQTFTKEDLLQWQAMFNLTHAEHYCELCHRGVKSKGPQHTLATADNIHAGKASSQRDLKRDSQWAGHRTSEFVWTRERPGVNIFSELYAAFLQAPVSEVSANRPTGQIVLVTIPAHAPDGVVNDCGALYELDPLHIGKLRGKTITPAAALDDALDAQHTYTSLDQDFSADNSAEVNNDGDDTSTAPQPTESATMGGPSPEPWDTTYAPGDLQALPTDYENDVLGIKDRNDAFLLHEIGRSLQIASKSDETMNDAALAAHIRETWANNEWRAPKTPETKDFEVRPHRESEVTKKLRKITAWQVRVAREQLQGLHVLPALPGTPAQQSL